MIESLELVKLSLWKRLSWMVQMFWRVEHIHAILAATRAWCQMGHNEGAEEELMNRLKGDFWRYEAAKRQRERRFRKIADWWPL